MLLKLIKNRSRKDGFLINLITMFLLSAVSASEVHNNFLFNHTFFVGKHWQQSSDTLKYDLSPEFKNLTPSNACFAGIDTNNIILFTTENKLYLMHSFIKPASSLTGLTKITADVPVESSIGTANSVVGLFNYTASNIDIAFIAVVVNQNKIEVHQLISSTYTVFKTDTLTIDIPTGSTIEKLYGGDAFSDGEQSSIWAIGSKGLIRRFTFNGSDWGSETNFDIEISETVTAFSLMAVGTLSGKIYEFIQGGFRYESQPVTSAINQISDIGAVGSDGTVIKKNSSGWNLFSVGTANYISSNFIALTEGSGVELISDSYNFTKSVLYDSLTRYSIFPVQMENYINSTPYYYLSKEPDTIVIVLHDDDGNFLVPSFMLAENDLAKNLLHMHPDTACRTGFEEISDSILTIILNPREIAFSASSRYAEYNPVAYRYIWKYQTFSTIGYWGCGDTFKIDLGDQCLVVINDIGMTHVDVRKKQVHLVM